MNDFPLQYAQQNQNIYNQPFTTGQLPTFNQPNAAPSWPPFPQEKPFMADGKKPLVVCNGEVTEAKDMDDAQRIAEEKAHQKSANAYILKPVKQVAPKRDVVTTDL